MPSDNRMVWSERGSAPKQIELNLVEVAISARLPEGAQVWLQLARSMGLPALLRLLDEVGGEKVHVPTREFFFETLWRPQRDDAICRAAQQGFTQEDIAKQFNLTQQRVGQVLEKAARTTLVGPA